MSIKDHIKLRLENPVYDSLPTDIRAQTAILLLAEICDRLEERIQKLESLEID
jgi:hypothetical protein